MGLSSIENVIEKNQEPLQTRGGGRTSSGRTSRLQAAMLWSSAVRHTLPQQLPPSPQLPRPPVSKDIMAKPTRCHDFVDFVEFSTLRFSTFRCLPNSRSQVRMQRTGFASKV